MRDGDHCVPPTPHGGSHLLLFFTENQPRSRERGQHEQGKQPGQGHEDRHPSAPEGLGEGTWVKKAAAKVTGQKPVHSVCIEGAIYGYCDASKRGVVTPAQRIAIDTTLGVINERYPGQFSSIPEFNDAQGRTKDEVLEVCKLAQIRLETDGLDGDDEVDELIPSRRK